MPLKILALLIAALAGFAMAVQGSLNAALGKIIGLAEATFIVHLSGLSLITLILLCGMGEKKWDQYNQAPWYFYLGGIFGVLIIYTVVYSIPRIGVANTTTAIIVAQIFTAVFIDHFGLFGLKENPFHILKGIGAVLLAIGSYLMLMKR